MKVVINRCYGGFGLSKEALLELAQPPCEHVKLMSPPDYYGKNWKEDMARDMERNSRMLWTLFLGGQVVCDEHRQDETRSCPRLVAVVEKLKDAANGWAANLSVVEIPDDVKFVIDEYDGIEHIAEEHRTWT